MTYWRDLRSEILGLLSRKDEHDQRKLTNGYITPAHEHLNTGSMYEPKLNKSNQTICRVIVQVSVLSPPPLVCL